MKTPDHYGTGTWGSRKSAVKMRAQQEALVKAKKYDEALQSGVDDVRARYGDQYDPHINEALGSAPRTPDGTIDWEAFKRKKP